jgi:hypothetical protein
MIDSEAKAKNALMRHLRTPGVLPPSFVCDRHEDRGFAGYPDITVTGNGLTSWIEAKLADPYVRHRGVQDVKMLRLGNAGIAFYLIYYDVKGQQSTHLVHPSRFKEWPLYRGVWCVGFDHDFVAKFIRDVHHVG